MQVLEDALGFLKVVETDEGKFVKIATLHPIGDPKDPYLRKVILGGQPFEEFFVIILEEGKPFVITREELANFYIEHRERLVLELSETDRGISVVVWSPLEELLEFVKQKRDIKGVLL